MDYARFNYVAQPEDNIGKNGLYPKIGDYDEWAIEWGYRLLPNYKSATDEVSALNKLTIEKSKNRRLWFGTELNQDDPNSQSEDLGDNAMKASEYGIENLQRILVKLPEWTKTPNSNYDDLQNMYGQIHTQFNRYIGHVTKNIGGVYENPKMVEQPGSVYERTPAAKQKEAMAFLDKQLFTTPTWLLHKEILDNIGTNSLQVIARSQETALSRLISANTLNKLIVAEAMDGNKAYRITEFFKDMNSSVLSELKAGEPIDVYRRNLQKMYVDRLIQLVNPAVSSISGGRIVTTSGMQSDLISVAKAELRSINSMIGSSLQKQSDSLTNYHLQDLSDRITQALDPKG
jgi:hypothetical protein